MPVWLGLNEVPVIPRENYGIMGILNLTPDSFYDGGQYNNNRCAYNHLKKMIAQSADIIDIGAESSRPGSELSTGVYSNSNNNQQKEYNNLMQFLEFLGNHTIPEKTCFSIDTWHARTVKSILKSSIHNNLGISIINDISGCQWDRELINVLTEYQPGYVLMYNSASPLEMFPKNRNIFQSRIIKDNKIKADIITKVKNYFEVQLEKLTKAGLKENHIILDPGIGFAKTIDEDLTILANLDLLQCFGRPILIGMSMKSMFEKLFDILPEQDRERSLTTALMTLVTAQKGALWHRVHHIHDTKITLNTLEVFRRYSL